MGTFGASTHPGPFLGRVDLPRPVAVSCAYVAADTRARLFAEPVGYQRRRYRPRVEGLTFRGMFSRSCSWWNGDHDLSPLYVLEHEQIHFALFEVAARRLNRDVPRMLSSAVAEAASPDSVIALARRQIEDALQRSIAETARLNVEFDRATSGGFSPNRQEAWRLRVEKDLEELARFAADPPPGRRAPGALRGLRGSLGAPDGRRRRVSPDRRPDLPSTPLLTTLETPLPAVDFLGACGEVFARFGEETQDSGNISYGVDIGGRRFFVKTPGDLGLLHRLGRSPRPGRSPEERRRPSPVPSPTGPCQPSTTSSRRPTAPCWSTTGSRACCCGSRPRSGPARAPPSTGSCTCRRRRSCGPSTRSTRSTAGWWSAAGSPATSTTGAVIYDFERHAVHLVDLDNYHLGPFVNEMGRMFGSTRFMAPEEFARGARIDESTTVFTMGRAAAVFFEPTGIRRRGVREVVERACREDPAERYPTMAAFREAWMRARDGAGTRQGR